MGILSFQNVTKQYLSNKKNAKPVIAIDNFSLEINRGELVVLLGPSGCGKTTLLRMIAGLETVTDGEIYLKGEKLISIPAHKRPIGMVFQNYALYPHMTGEENLLYAVKLHKVEKPEIKKRLKSTCDILELDIALLKRRPDEMSGGQRQRVALGRALMQQPEVFLLDEPFSNLDQNLRMHLRRKICEIQKELGLTLLLVTHDQGDALAMGDNIVLMCEGKVMQNSSPDLLYNNPETLFAASFIGWPQINLFRGKIVKRDGATYFQETDNHFVIPIKSFHRLIGTEAIFAIRPENVYLNERQNRGESGGIFSINEENIGATHFTYAKSKNFQITGINQKMKITIGAPVCCELRLQNGRIFDLEGKYLMEVTQQQTIVF